jgi:hypothetical protein
VIDYSRGHITVRDRPKLEKLVCECYSVVKKETDRLLPYVPQRRETIKSKSRSKKRMAKTEDPPGLERPSTEN